MSWKLYKGGQGSTKEGNGQNVSIAQIGMLRISKELAEAIGVEFKFAELYFDDASRQIGIKLINSDPEPYHHRFRTDQNGANVVNAKGFLRHFKIIPNNTISCPAQWDAAKKLITIDLSRGIVSAKAKLRKSTT